MCDSYFEYPIPETIREASEWRKLEPLGRNHPFLAGQAERARRIVEEVGREMPIFYNVFAPFSSIRFGAGEGRVMNDLQKDPTAVMHALDVIAQDSAALTEMLIRESGCDGIYFWTKSPALRAIWSKNRCRRIRSPGSAFPSARRCPEQ